MSEFGRMAGISYLNIGLKVLVCGDYREYLFLISHLNLGVPRVSGVSNNRNSDALLASSTC